MDLFSSPFRGIGSPRMSHDGIVRPDEEIQHKSFPAVSLSICLRVYASSRAAPSPCVSLHACRSATRGCVGATTRNASHARVHASRNRPASDGARDDATRENAFAFPANHREPRATTAAQPLRFIPFSKIHLLIIYNPPEDTASFDCFCFE